MTGPIFDTHAHYSARAFDADRFALLDSLPAKGVVGVCEQATHSGDAPRVLELAQQYTSAESIPTYWDSRSDAATRIARYLLDQATDVRFFVGRAKNPSHQSPQLHIDFSIKMSIVEKLETLLREMGKQVTVEYC